MVEKEKLSISLPKDTASALRGTSEKTGVTISNLIEFALNRPTWYFELQALSKERLRKDEEVFVAMAEQYLETENK